MTRSMFHVEHWVGYLGRYDVVIVIAFCYHNYSINKYKENKMNRFKSIKKEVGKQFYAEYYQDLDKETVAPIRWKNILKLNKARREMLVTEFVICDMDISDKDKELYFKAKRVKKLKFKDKLKENLDFQRHIDKHAVDGKVAIVYGGVDCDHSRWDNRVAIVNANITSVIGWENDYMEYAEGAQWCDIEPMAYALSLKESSRDLAMEAFEDGHPHVIYGGV